MIMTNIIKPFESIPGPKLYKLITNKWRYIPIIGQYNIYRSDLNGEYNLKKYGKLVREVIQPNHTILHVFDPKDIESVFRQEGKYPYRRSHRALLKYRKERPQQYNSGGLFPENGEEWYRIRKTFHQSLLNQINVNKYITGYQNVTEDLVSFIYKNRDNKHEMVDFERDLYKWALENTFLMALDTRLGCLNLKLSDDSIVMRLIKAGHDTHEAVMKTELSNKWEKSVTSDYKLLVKGQDIMASVVNDFLEIKINKLKHQTDDTLLSNFLLNKEVDRKDLFALINDLLLAGIDTTSFTSGFVLYYLSRNLQCQQILRNEIRSVLKTKCEPLCWEKLSQMSYLKACVKEAMRLRPLSMGVGRLTTQDIIIDDYNVPKGTMIITQNQTSCRQAEYFSDAESFVPERWLKGSKHDSSKPSPFLVLPYGYGPRMCIGRRFSETQIYILVATLLQHFRVEYHYQDIGIKTRLINFPDKPMKFRFVSL